MKTIKTLAAVLAFASPALALPEAATLEAAMPIAQEQNRNIFVDFTGTDWCKACIHLRTKIIDSAEFEQAMGGKFILVSVDFPRTPALVEKISKEEWKRRESLLISYKIEGLPGVVLMDEKGLPFEVIHGARQTTADYLPLVQEGLGKRAARDAALAAAAGQQGLERAKLLDQALKAVPEVCRDKYADIIREINELDPENTLGYKGYLEKPALLVAQMNALRELTSTFVGKFSPEELRSCISQLDEFLAQPDLQPEVRQRALSCKSDSYAFLREWKNSHELRKQAEAAAPDTRLGKKLKRDSAYFEAVVIPKLQEQGQWK